MRSLVRLEISRWHHSGRQRDCSTEAARALRLLISGFRSPVLKMVEPRYLKVGNSTEPIIFNYQGLLTGM